MQIAKIAKTFERFTVNNSPLLLTGIAVAGVISTAVLTHKSAVKAVKHLSSEDLSPWDYSAKKDIIRQTWKFYIPPVSVAAVTITCIVLSNRIGTRRAAALAAAYTVSEKAFEEYREKIVERIGENEERKARDELAQDRVNRNPASQTEVLITDGGSVLCYDQYTGRYFTSTMERIKKAQNDTNYEIINHDYATLNSYYGRVGLAPVKFGDDMGWSTAEKLEIKFSTVMSDDDKPCIATEFYVEPVRDFHLTH